MLHREQEKSEQALLAPPSVNYISAPIRFLQLFTSFLRICIKIHTFLWIFGYLALKAPMLYKTSINKFVNTFFLLICFFVMVASAIAQWTHRTKLDLRLSLSTIHHLSSIFTDNSTQ
jgi:hypothetical protein